MKNQKKKEQGLRKQIWGTGVGYT